MKNIINIMTSCDDNIAAYIMPQLVSINKNLNMYHINFYVMHSKISLKNMQLIKNFAETLDNITFHELRVRDNKLFNMIEKYGDGRGIKGGRLWPNEAYYWYFAHLYLPQDMERVIYIDAGDIIITGDIGEYYFKDFNNKLIIANARLLITHEGKTDFFQKSDLENKQILGQVLGAGTFCAGSIVLNLEKFREVIKDDFIDNYIESLKKIYPGEKCLFNGDQGLASGAFAGEIEYFMKPGEKDVWYRPYNFPVGNLYEREKEDFDFPICVLHYNASLTLKPWVARFDISEIAKYDFRVDGAAGPAPYMATPAIIELNEVWWEYCKETPIYEELDYRARIAADVLQKYFLPLCNEYNKLFVKNKDSEEKNKIPDYIDDFIKNGEILFSMGDYSELVQVCREFLKETKDDRIYSMLASAEFSLGDVESAERNVRAGLNINPNNPDLLYNLDYILQHKKNG